MLFTKVSCLPCLLVSSFEKDYLLAFGENAANLSFLLGCSQYGYCGSTSAYCGTGCNPSGGSCTKVTTTTSSQQTTTLTSTSSAASPTKTKLRTSPDGTCGKASGYTCMGSRYGLCCSAEGKCGNLIFSIFSQPYCGKGCQPAYGICL